MGLRIYNPKRSRLRDVRRQRQAITDASGKWVAEGIGSKTVRIRSAKSGAVVAHLVHQTKVQAVAFRPDSRSVVTLGSRYFAEDFPIREWHFDGTGSIAEIRQRERIDKILFSKDAKLIFTRTQAGPQSWNLPHRHEQTRVSQLQPTAKDEDSQSISMPARFDVLRIKNRLDVIDRIDKSVVRSIDIDAETFATAVSGDGKWLALIAKLTGVIRVWRISDGFEIIRIENDEPVKELGVSPDGRWLASLHEAGIVGLWALNPPDLIAQACDRLPAPCP